MSTPSPQPPRPRLKKNDLARTFKHDCDRQLRISLGPRAHVASYGITPLRDPGPRPGIHLVTGAGHDWERQKFEDLVRVFGPDAVRFHRPVLSGPFEPVDLLAELRTPEPRRFVIEGQFRVPADFAPNCAALAEAYGLELTDARPDIVWLRSYPTGSPLLTPVEPGCEPEFELHIIDVKLAAEPTLRHFTEVTFYALALAALVHAHGLEGRYAVAAQGFVWPGTYDEGKFRSDVATAREAGVPEPEDVALAEQLESVPYEVYGVHVQQFFEERLPRVLRTSPTALNWFITPTCQLCENLRHCQAQADREDNLCRIPWLTRGQAEILRQEGISTVGELVEAIEQDSPAWRRARTVSLQLLADAQAIRARARALCEGRPVLVPDRRSALMPRWADLRFFTSIHFDPGSGLTFAIGLNVVYFPPGRERSAGGIPNRPDTASYMLLVEQRDERRERLRLLDYLRVVNDWLRRAVADGASVHFYFWDQLELRQLRRLLERHMLHAEVAQEVEWLLRMFPPDAQLPDVEFFKSQPGSVVKDVLRTLVGLPVPYTYTLLRSAASFNPPLLQNGQPYRFAVPWGFWTELSDQIPFERAYEMWGGQVFLRRYGPDGQPSARPILHTELMDELRRAVQVHLRALEHIVSTTQRVLGDRLMLRKEALSLAPPNPLNLPDRARQLVTYERLDAVVAEMENRRERALPLEEREARFVSLRGLRLINDATAEAICDEIRQENPRYLGRQLLVFEFEPTSRDARIKIGDFLFALWNGDDHDLLDRPWRRVLGLEFDEAVELVGSAARANRPTHYPLQMEVAELRAAEATPVIVLSPADPDLFALALEHGVIDLGRPLVLDPLFVDFTTRRIVDTLRSIGGSARGARRSRSLEPAYTLLHGPVQVEPPSPHPLAEVLLADAHAGSSLNPEQEVAFRAGLTAPLMLLWGPAGTGKTAVLASIVRAALLAARTERRPLRICLGAATYNAIDKLMQDVAGVLDRPDARGGAGLLEDVRLYRVRHKSAQPPHDPRVVDVLRDGAGSDDLVALLDQPDRRFVVGGTAHQFWQLARWREGEARSSVARWFDLLILDEASQVTVTDAASYFCLLAADGRVILAGDHRQLGPVREFELPDTQGGLFDSIFTYMQQTHGVQPIQLVRNYRTNHEIAGWPRVRFYGDRYLAHYPDRRLRLASPIPATDEPPPDWLAALPWTRTWATILDPEWPVVVVTYQARHDTLSNPFEAQAVAAMAELLRRHLSREALADCESAVRAFWSERLAIITPHRAQMSMISNLLVLSSAFPRRPPPQVDTVDRFQGQERDVILASYSVSDPDFIAAEERFILDPRRFNVTLTRARSKFVVLVSESLVQHLPYDKDVAEQAASFQLFVERYCGQAEAAELPYFAAGTLRSMPVRIRRITTATPPAGVENAARL